MCDRIRILEFIVIGEIFYDLRSFLQSFNSVLTLRNFQFFRGNDSVHVVISMNDGFIQIFDRWHFKKSLGDSGRFNFTGKSSFNAVAM